MINLVLNKKEIKIRRLEDKDLKDVSKFLDYINSLIEEGAKIFIKNKKTIKEEREYLKEKLKNIKNKKDIVLIAKHNEKIIGMAHVGLLAEKQDHIGTFGIGVIKEYRGFGIGLHLSNKVINLAKKELKNLKFIQLNAFSNNKPAINLYKKIGFKIVAVLPKQVQDKKKLVDEIVMIKK